MDTGTQIWFVARGLSAVSNAGHVDNGMSTPSTVAAVAAGDVAGGVAPPSSRKKQRWAGSSRVKTSSVDSEA